MNSFLRHGSNMYDHCSKINLSLNSLIWLCSVALFHILSHISKESFTLQVFQIHEYPYLGGGKFCGWKTVLMFNLAKILLISVIVLPSKGRNAIFFIVSLLFSSPAYCQVDQIIWVSHWPKNSFLDDESLLVYFFSYKILQTLYNKLLRTVDFCSGWLYLQYLR